MKVRLLFSVSENALPALITVRTFDGRLILYEKVYRRRNAVCFCTCAKNLIITVRPFSDDYYEQSYFIKLGRRPCYDLRLDFSFTAQNGESLQTFYLFDENYLFPIEEANLLFRRQL